MLGTVASITARACKDGYAVAAANVGSSIEVCAALEAASELHAPLILDVLQQNLTSQPREFCAWITAMCRHASVPVALNIDVCRRDQRNNMRSDIDNVASRAARL